MPFDPHFRYEEYTQVDFEFNGRELTAYVSLKDRDATKKKVAVDPDNEDWELGDVVRCEDSTTGEVLEVTKGMKAAIIFAFREENAEMREGEDEWRNSFRPDKK